MGALPALLEPPPEVAPLVPTAPPLPDEDEGALAELFGMPASLLPHAGLSERTRATAENEVRSPTEG